MATYAAYRHVELDRVGLGKRRVLKPPGGGSSFSFGEEDDIAPMKAKTSTSPAPAPAPAQQEATPPKNDNQDQSPKAETNGITPTESPKDNATPTKENNPTSATNGVAVNGSVTNGSSTSGSSTLNSPRVDTQTRLFGESPRPESASRGNRRVRDHHHSNIIIAEENDKGINTPKPVYRRMWTRRDPVTGVGVLCWDLHAPRFAPIKRKANPVGNGTPEAKSPEVKTPEQPQPQQKQRIPPGGFSTKLW